MIDKLWTAWYVLARGVLKTRRAAKTFTAAIRTRPDTSFDQYMVDHGDVGNLCGWSSGDGPTDEDMARASRFLARAKNWTPLAWWLYGWACQAKTAALCAWCDLTDHVYVDDSSFGPDSGTERLSCSRCGWSWSHTYY